MLASSLPLHESFKPEYLEYYGIFPLGVESGCLRVAATGDPCPEVLEDLELTFGLPLAMVPVERDDVIEAVRAAFSAAQSTDALVRSLDDDLVGPTDGGPAGEVLEADARDLANQPPVVRYVNLLIREAHEARASDIHVEATAGGVAVRFRIDGVLVSATAPPRGLQAAVVSRLKLIADLDIAERRSPQDGRIRIRLDQRDLDLRVSTVPTLHGESIVLRLLDHRGAPEGLGALGMTEEVLSGFVAAARSSHGIVLATGPTGSGKTTTLYGALQLRDVQREKIITIEDPVEYRLSGVTQVPVNAKAGMSFSSGLRSVLRQDPDVVMVGEMRDAETARIAVQAAMTGHLVFSTVHTNDAASAVARLVDLGIEPYLVAATLRGILAQRLVRRVCDHCGERVEPDASFFALVAAVDAEARLRAGAGCAVCHQTGFVGRLGLFEWIGVDDRLRGLLATTADAMTIRGHAVAAGMRPIREDGRRKVELGFTTAREVLRVVST